MKVKKVKRGVVDYRNAFKYLLKDSHYGDLFALLRKIKVKLAPLSIFCYSDRVRPWLCQLQKEVEHHYPAFSSFKGKINPYCLHTAPNLDPSRVVCFVIKQYIETNQLCVFKEQVLKKHPDFSFTYVPFKTLQELKREILQNRTPRFLPLEEEFFKLLNKKTFD